MTQTKFPEIRQMAILSTVVLPREEVDILWARAEEGACLLNVQNDDGDANALLLSDRDAAAADMAFVTLYVEHDAPYLPPGPRQGFPVLRRILDAAQREGLQYVRFDRDAEPGDWPTYYSAHED